MHLQPQNLPSALAKRSLINGCEINIKSFQGLNGNEPIKYSPSIFLTSYNHPQYIIIKFIKWDIF